ncbi:MAG: radical SAM protein [Candidatus Omnitrophota bacterium]
MSKKKYKYIYGPVPSWRLGSSLGIDPISDKKKICSFDCIYCQLGKTKVHTKKRKIFIPTEKVIEELKSLPPVGIDYITFSGRGEPTLAKNLGEMIAEVKRIRKEPIAVLTNAGLLYEKEVRENLSQADFVVAKLDAASEAVFKKMNGPVKGINLSKVIGGIKKFSSNHRGKLALQIMFVEENEKYAKEISQLARKVGADEVQLNTPLRPCAVKPLAKKKMKEIEKYFKGLNVISVYKSVRKKVKPVSKKDTLKRRGKI